MCAWPTALPATRVVLGFCVALPDSVPVAPLLGLPSGAAPSPVSPWEVASYMECAVWTGGTRQTLRARWLHRVPGVSGSPIPAGASGLPWCQPDGLARYSVSSHIEHKHRWI